MINKPTTTLRDIAAAFLLCMGLALTGADMPEKPLLAQLAVNLVGVAGLSVGFRLLPQQTRTEGENDGKL